MATNDIAVIGLNAQGKALAQNMKRLKYNSAVYDADFEKAMAFSKKMVSYNKAYQDIKSCIVSVAIPRKIFLSVTSQQIDNVISIMLPYLSQGDTVIEMGESNYIDTRKRAIQLQNKKIRFLDIAITGGNDMFSDGVGIIAGGEDDTFGASSRLLRQLSKDYKGYSSCLHSGSFGTAQFTKMVHDSIENAMLQIIADGYFMLRVLGKMTCEEVASAFGFMNEELCSYLIKMTIHILMQYDANSGEPLIDLILDSATYSKNAAHALKDALTRKLPALLNSQALYWQHLSQQRKKRQMTIMPVATDLAEYKGGNVKLIDIIKNAVKVSWIAAYAQGFDMLESATDNDEWKYDACEVSRIWCSASTIKSSLLEHIHSVYKNNDNLLDITHDATLANMLKSDIQGLRDVVCLSAKHAVCAPAFMSALSYFDGLAQETLPANLVQAQHNFLGRAQVKRYDVQGEFDIDWFE